MRTFWIVCFCLIAVAYLALCVGFAIEERAKRKREGR